MTAEEKSERIEQYLQGRLSKAEADAFETEMLADPALADEVALERDLLESLTETDVHTFRATVETIHRQKQEAQIIPFVSRRRWILAASVLALVVAGYFVVDGLLTPSPGALYQAYFEAPAAEEFMSPVVFKVRDEEETAVFTPKEQALRKVADLYREKNYAVALTAMQAIEPENAAAHAYQLGVLYLVNGQPEEALEQFALGESANRTGAIWYRALALLQLDRPAEAREQLEKLRGQTSTWSDKVEKVLKKLK